MADYASDSSDGEFTETNVLLGYASKEAEEDTISKLGGTPVCRFHIFYYELLCAKALRDDNMLNEMDV